MYVYIYIYRYIHHNLIASKYINRILLLLNSLLGKLLTAKKYLPLKIDQLIKGQQEKKDGEGPSST